MIAAHKAGIAYYRNNRPQDVTREQLASHARSCGWHGEDNESWLAGFYGERNRDRINQDHPYRLETDSDLIPGR